MNIRVVSVLVLVALLVGLVMPVSAQSSENPICNGLNPADCEIFVAALEAMESIRSLTVPEWSMSFVGDGPEGPVQFESGGTGAFASDSMAGLALHLVIPTIRIASPEGTYSGGFEIIIAEGKVHTKLQHEWSMTSDLDDLDDLDDVGGLPPDTMGKTLLTERGPDIELFGEPMAVFTTTVDMQHVLGIMMVAPVAIIVNVLVEILSEVSLGETAIEIPTEQEMLQLAMMLISQLPTFTITVEQWVGLDDGYIHRIEMNMRFNFDPSELGSEVDIEAEPALGRFRFVAVVDKINEPVEIRVP